MSGLQFGLNVKAKKGNGASAFASRTNKPASGASQARSASSVFGGDADDDEDDDNDDDGNAFGKSFASSSTTKPKPTPSVSASASASANAAVNRSLRTYATSTAQSLSVIEQQNAALAQDATVFDYDGVYDQLKAGDRLKELVRKKEAAAGKSKYIEDMLRSRDLRQQDLQIAQEKKIERERKAEGELYADKEQFVTPAYKAAKEAARLAEEEERKREEEAAKDKDGKRMQGFYRHMLSEQTRLRPGIDDTMAKALGVKDAQERLQLAAELAGEMEKDKEKEEKEQIEKARAEGLRVVLNDEGQVVDKRDLLKSGLNVFKKKDEAPSTSKSSFSSSRDLDRNRRDYRDRDRDHRGDSRGRNGGRDQRHSVSSHEIPDQRQRSRMTEQIEQQLLEKEKQREQEEKERQGAIREALKRKNQDDQVMDAKARYLARKKAAAEAAAAGRSGGD